MTVVGIERCGNIAMLIAHCDLAARLVDAYGIRESYEFTSMEGIVGLRCQWTEDAGVLVALDPLVN